MTLAIHIHRFASSSAVNAVRLTKIVNTHALSFVKVVHLLFASSPSAGIFIGRLVVQMEVASLDALLDAIM